MTVALQLTVVGVQLHFFLVFSTKKEKKYVQLGNSGDWLDLASYLKIKFLW